MNLVEVLVAGSLVLGSATGSLGIWTQTAQATRSAEDLLEQQRVADARLLAVQARLQVLAAQQRARSQPVPAECPALSELEPLEASGTHDPALALALDDSAQLLTVRVQAGRYPPRERVFDLVAYGLCGGEP